MPRSVQKWFPFDLRLLIDQVSRPGALTWCTGGSRGANVWRIHRFWIRAAVPCWILSGRQAVAAGAIYSRAPPWCRSKPSGEHWRSCATRAGSSTLLGPCRGDRDGGRSRSTLHWASAGPQPAKRLALSVEVEELVADPNSARFMNSDSLRIGFCLAPFPVKAAYSIRGRHVHGGRDMANGR